MARHPRIRFEGALYHIYSRGNHREPIGHTAQDFRILERYMIEAALRTDVQPRLWQPLPNHNHAAVETPRGNISEFMQRWLSRYAQYYNRVYGKSGHLFQGRFGSTLVQTDAHLHALLRYIALQIEKVSNPASVPDYCRQYAGMRFWMGETCPPQVFRWIKPMLLLFGNDLESGRLNFKKFLKDGLDGKNWEAFYTPKNDVLGDDDFTERMEKLRQPAAALFVPEWRKSQLLGEILGAADQTFGVTVEMLRSSKQNQSLSRIRQAIVGVSQAAGLSGASLARAMQRGQPAVTAMRNRAQINAVAEMEALKTTLGLA